MKQKAVIISLLLVLFYSCATEKQEEDMGITSFELTFEEKPISRMYILSLPYSSQKKHFRIFAADTPYAIDIVGIEVDGTPLQLEWGGINFELLYSFSTRRVKKDETLFFIRMTWNKNGRNELVWSGKRPDINGIDSYVIKEGDKVMRIRYRVAFPFPFVTIRKLWRKQIPEWAYSPEFEAVVDLSDVFQQMEE